MRVVLLLLTVVLISCRREPKTYAYPDYSAETEAEFPYKTLDEPLVYKASNLDSVVFTILSKTLSKTKNSKSPVNESGNRTELSQNWVSMDASPYTYKVSTYRDQAVFIFDHSFSLYSFRTSLANNPLSVSNQLAGSPIVEITTKWDSLTVFGKVYYNVVQLETYNSPAPKGGMWVTAVRFCRSDGVIGFQNERSGRWYQLKPRK